MKTAFITGASGGIGLEIARVFAFKGCNLILVARNEIRLREIADELSSKDVSVEYYAKDLSVLLNAKDVFDDIVRRNIKVDYVVNNAGFGIDGREIEISWERELEMLNLNMITLTFFTKMFAQQMAASGGGRILNVSSIGGFIPGPYMAGYCATKAYVLHFSEAIHEEMKNDGVSVTALCPGVTDTNFHNVAQTLQTGMFKNMSTASAADVAAYGYRIMMKGKSFGIYGTINKIFIFSRRFAPRRLVSQISGRLLR
jgi:short-subunit dehydrogenase